MLTELTETKREGPFDLAETRRFRDGTLALKREERHGKPLQCLFRDESHAGAARMLGEVALRGRLPKVPSQIAGIDV